MSWTEVRQRSLALGLGTGLTVSGLWAAGLVLIAVGTAAQLPDPLAMDGDPCCPGPDSWVDVAIWSLSAVLLSALDAGVILGGVACLSFGVRHRSPSRRI